MKITVNQLRRIIREEIEKTVRLNENVDDELVNPEQRAELDKITKYPDLSKMFTQEEMANALVSENYKVIPKIMGVDAFDKPEVEDALIYMFPQMRFNRSWREALVSAVLVATSKGMTHPRPTPQDNPFGLKAAFVKP
jgi:hypothetical protein